MIIFLEKEEITINASLYKNGIIQGNSLNIVDVSEGVPKDNYSIVINGNSFTIKNKFKYLKNKVKVQCSYDDENIVKVFEFTLRGLY